MKAFKSIFVIFLVSIIAFIPTAAMASSNESNSNDKIIQELQTYGEENKIELGTPTRAMTEVNFPTTPWRTQTIYFRRTNKNTPITMTANNMGSNYVDACIFKQGSTTETIGITKTIKPGVNTIVWPTSELNDELNVYIFFTMYKTATNYMQVSITY